MLRAIPAWIRTGFLRRDECLDAHLGAKLADEQQLRAIHGEPALLQRANELGVVVAQHAGRRA